jgi:hypothetical protein
MLGGRTMFHVVARRGCWQIIRDGTPGSVFTHKHDAIARATATARSLPSSRVIVHARDGRIENDYTYPANAAGSASTQRRCHDIPGRRVRAR